MKRDWFSSFLLITFLSICISVEGGTPKSSWSGKYRHVTGKFELIIKQWDTDGLSVDIIRKNKPNDPPYGSFVAFIKRKNLAEYADARERSCKVLLKRVTEGIIIYDHCGGSGEDAGLYQKTE